MPPGAERHIFQLVEGDIFLEAFEIEGVGFKTQDAAARSCGAGEEIRGAPAITAEVDDDIVGAQRGLLEIEFCRGVGLRQR